MDVASGADRHLDITFGLQVVESSSLVSILFREVLTIPTSPFPFTSRWFFRYLFPYFFIADPLPAFNWWAVSVGVA